MDAKLNYSENVEPKVKVRRELIAGRRSKNEKERRKISRESL